MCLLSFPTCGITRGYTNEDADEAPSVRRTWGETDHRWQSGAGHPVRDNGFVTAPASFYDEIAGHPVFAGIVERFYAVVTDDPVLRPLYPEEDLGPAEVR